MNVKFTKTDAYLVLVFFVIAIPIALTGYGYQNGWFVPIMETIIYAISTMGLSYLIVYKLFPRYFPKNQIVRLFVWTVLLMFIAGFLEFIGYRLVSGRSVTALFGKVSVYFETIISSAENAGILIGLLLGKKFTDTQLALQKRDTEKRENELRLLKSQVDPHFLFNNLNTVDSLIDTDPKTAKLYLSKLSQLYRYLIHTKDDEVVDLDEELEFAKNYAFLLEQRYGGAYRFDFGATSSDDSLIPPGALQTCLENVVKHNGGTDKKPVLTTIKIDMDYVVVSNNKAPKLKAVESTGIGLTNLRARYKLLSDKDLAIIDQDNFVVKLPLLKPVT